MTIFDYMDYATATATTTATATAAAIATFLTVYPPQANCLLF